MEGCVGVAAASTATESDVGVARWGSEPQIFKAEAGAAAAVGLGRGMREARAGPTHPSPGAGDRRGVELAAIRANADVVGP